MIKINEITPGEENLTFIAKVVSATPVGKNVRLVLGDETGIVNAFLQQSDLLEVGKTVFLNGAQSNVVKEHIEIQRARVDTARREIKEVSQELNISEKAWIPV